jgi:soluble lytic murein transglycosylase-like protein
MEWMFVGLGVLIILVVGVQFVLGFFPRPEKLSPPTILHNQNYVNFIRSYNQRLSVSEVNTIIGETGLCAHVSGIEQSTILALIAIESGFDPLAISSQGAIGLTQVNSRVWKDATFDIVGSIVSGCQKLIYYKMREHGYLVPTLFSYNSDSPDGKPKGKKNKEEAVKNKINFAKSVLGLASRLDKGEWEKPKGEEKK